MHTRNTVIGFGLAFGAGMFLMYGIDRRLTNGGTLAASAEPSAETPSGAAAVTTLTPANPGAVKVELFVMSQCPYGVEAEQKFKDVVDKFGADIDFKVEFIGDDKDGELSSMHGPKEVKGDLVQICAQKYSPKWFDMILCQNKNPRAVDLNWESCAKDAGMPVSQIKSCAEGKEGKDLLAASFSRSESLGVSGSPTIHIGGKNYEGRRGVNDLSRAICAAYTGDKPAACSSIPEPATVNVTILSDKRCAECDAKGLEEQVRGLIAKPNITVLDYADAGGKKLFDEIKPMELPAVIFDDTLLKDPETAQAVNRGLKEIHGHKVISVGEWNPLCSDAGGCDLAECKSTMECRAEMPKRLDLFVMSQCPFGVQALDAMKEVIENFKAANEKLDFAVHYIGDGDASGLQSMHGPAEVAEDLREICVQAHYGKDQKFMEYVWCRNKNIKDPGWESCTGGKTGFDTDEIKKCSEGEEGKKLLADSFALSKSSGVSGSPTWLANNKFKFSGRDPESIKTALCSHNAGMAGCDKALTGPQQNAAPAQAGCGN